MSSSSQKPSFLQGDSNMNDPATLRKRISELEKENKQLKEESKGSGGGDPYS